MRWINVKERLPDTDECVLVIVSGKYKDIELVDAYELANYFSGCGWCLDSYPDMEDLSITWWMYLPDPPDAYPVHAAGVCRCKECRYWHEGTGYCDKNSYFVDSVGESCSPAQSRYWTMFDADDFCSKAERRNDDG